MPRLGLDPGERAKERRPVWFPACQRGDDVTVLVETTPQPVTLEPLGPVRGQCLYLVTVDVDPQSVIRHALGGFELTGEAGLERAVDRGAPYMRGMTQLMRERANPVAGSPGVNGRSDLEQCVHTALQPVEHQFVVTQLVSDRDDFVPVGQTFSRVVGSEQCPAPVAKRVGE